MDNQESIMTQLSKTKRIHNEHLFKKINIQHVEAIEEVTSGMTRSVMTADFICECSDIDCVEKIGMSPDKFMQISKKRNHFIIRPHHEHADIERVVGKNLPEYVIVEKYTSAQYP